MSKFIIRKEKGAKLKVITPEAGEVWKSINWADVEGMVEEKIGLMKVKTGTGKEGNSIARSEVERIVEEKIGSMKVNPGTESVGHANGDMKNKNDLGGRIIEEDII